MTMAERVNHPAHYNAGGIECIDALEAATIGLEGIEAFCTANAIKYLWRWKRKNGEEDLQKAIWYINRIIDRAGKPPEERKGLFNMTENKHGFMPKQEITIGGIAFTIIQTAESWVKCIASECIGNGVFDTKNRNDFAASASGLSRATNTGFFAATFRSFRTLGGGQLHRTARKIHSSATSFPTVRRATTTRTTGATAFARFAF